MGTQAVILSYLQSCASGKLGMAECGPLWQLVVIAVFLVGAVVALAVLRLRPRPEKA